MRIGTLNQLLENYYMDYCEQAFADFCDFHWQCSFQKKNHRCANVFSGHAKGHQIAMGKVLAYGDYIPSYHYKIDLCIWLRKLEKEISKIEGFKDARPNSKVKKSPSDLHLENMKTFYRSIGSASNFRSHYTCYCCLREIPIHPLACGHVLCSPYSWRCWNIRYVKHKISVPLLNSCHHLLEFGSYAWMGKIIMLFG